MPKIQIALFYEHTIVRNLIKDYLSSQPQLEVTQQANVFPQLLLQLQDNEVDVIMMDIFMPSYNMQSIVKQIGEHFPQIPILLLPTSTDIANNIKLLSELIKLGIRGCISKVEDPEELINAIKTVYQNKVYINNLLTEALYHERTLYISNYFHVTFDDREKKIIKMLWEEKSNKEISDEVFLSIRSIEKIRLDLKKKIGVKSTIGIIKYAIREEIL